MTDTRKQIIELIEPFMDKTLNETCLVSSHKGIGYLFYKNNFSEIEYFTNGNHYCLEEYKCRIIGHYDITAVLKYIENKGWGYMSCNNSKIAIGTFVDGDFEHNFSIPEKPLHLYKEEEDESLLTLLQQLGTKQQ